MPYTPSESCSWHFYETSVFRQTALLSPSGDERAFFQKDRDKSYIDLEVCEIGKEKTIGVGAHRRWTVLPGRLQEITQKVRNLHQAGSHL